MLASEARALDGAMRRFKGDALQKYARAFDRLEQFGERLKRHSDRPAAARPAPGRPARQAARELFVPFGAQSRLCPGARPGRPAGAGRRGPACRRHDRHRVRRRRGARAGERRAPARGPYRRRATRASGSGGNQGRNTVVPTQREARSGGTRLLRTKGSIGEHEDESGAPLSAETIKNFLYASTATSRCRC